MNIEHKAYIKIPGADNYCFEAKFYIRSFDLNCGERFFYPEITEINVVSQIGNDYEQDFMDYIDAETYEEIHSHCQKKIDRYIESKKYENIERPEVILYT